ncbi:hypothetical protein P152DRAFT_372344, partial [Eremomyces bilateralis CBS 781.70]
LKRRSPDDYERLTNGDHPAKRQKKVIRALKYKQPFAELALESPQDDSVFHAQLVRSISTVLTRVGFDGAKPSALESFRSEVQEYMLHFLGTVRASMTNSRRTHPIPQDFVLALVNSGITPSELLGHLDHHLPPEVSLPPLQAAPRETDTVPKRDLFSIDAADTTKRRFIPATMPHYPSKHTWQSTPTVISRITDPLQIREKSTQEGIVAEQALRKLVAARQRGAANKTFGEGHKTQKRELERRWEDGMMEMIRMDDEEARRQRVDFEGDADMGAGDVDVMNAAAEASNGAFGVDTGMVVNWDRKYWR